MDRYFALARGHAGRNLPALEMTKWFDTNYHYLTPELEADTPWTPGAHPVLESVRRARALGFTPKAALIGPFTWLALGKARQGTDPGPCWNAFCPSMRRCCGNWPRSAP